MIFNEHLSGGWGYDGKIQVVMVDKNDAKAKFVNVINETILVLEDQKVTSTLFVVVVSRLPEENQQTVSWEALDLFQAYYLQTVVRKIISSG